MKSELLDGVEGMDPEEVFPEGLGEAVDAAVVFGFGHKGPGALDPQEPQFVLDTLARSALPWAWRSDRPERIPATYSSKCSRIPGEPARGL